MRLLLAAVGAPSGTLAPAVAEYEERARRYFDLEVIEVQGGGRGSAAEVRRREGVELLRRIPEEGERFALTRTGKGLTSRGLARYLGRVATYGRPGPVFLIGGAHGLPDPVLERSHHRLSLSPLTLPHELARLVLVEQLYRAGTILRGEPYHRERTDPDEEGARTP